MEHLHSLIHEHRTMVFYEAPHKLLSTLRDMYAVLGDKDVVLVRGLRRFHESVWRGTLSEAVAYHEANPPKGEYVLILGGMPEEESPDPLEDAVALARKLTEEKTCRSRPRRGEPRSSPAVPRARFIRRFWQSGRMIPRRFFHL
jgi:16S rRNA (cytidine1402-2'-O)-methyltransferase